MLSTALNFSIRATGRCSTKKRITYYINYGFFTSAKAKGIESEWFLILFQAESYKNP